jgi:hypothetical protein
VFLHIRFNPNRSNGKTPLLVDKGVNTSVDEDEDAEDEDYTGETGDEADEEVVVDEEVEETTEKMKKATVKPAVKPAAKPSPAKAAPKVAARDPIIDEIPDDWRNDYVAWTHYRKINGLSTQIVSVRFQVPGSLATDYKPVIHPTGQYLDLVWKQPPWYRRPQSVKDAHEARWRGSAGFEKLKDDSSKVTNYRNSNSLTTNQFPDGQVVKIQRIKLDDQVKTDVGFATIEGPPRNGAPYPGYGLEIQQLPGTHTVIYWFNVDMYGAKPPDVTKAAPTPMYASNTRNNDDSDDEGASMNTN